MRGREDRDPNALRYSGKPGHVESYFLRANDPDRPRALWLKATVFAPIDGPAEMESWLIYFDGSRARPIAGRESVPLVGPVTEAVPGATRVHAARLHFELAGRGSAAGTVRTSTGDAHVDVTWSRSQSPVGAPLSMLPRRLAHGGSFPRSKLLSPLPSLLFSGTLDVNGEHVELRGWRGMQGHNWGREHAFEYAWGQCVFAPEGSEPEAMVEGLSARVRIGGRTTPLISCLAVRRGPRTFRFDRLVDLWRQHASVEADRWSLRMSGNDGEARLEMDATGRPIACLGYRNPDGHKSYCFNTKLATVRLQVQPARGSAFECRSEHGGALELLRRTPDPRFPDVV